jgi:phospholipase C
MAEPRAEVDRIVVVMMENRSFDHMLGYLSRPRWRLGDPADEGSTVDGLADDVTVTWDGADYSTFPLGTTRWEYEDPPHEGRRVAWQVEDPARYIATYLEKHPEGDPLGVMSYLTPAEVPVYDFFAREFCVCDSWYCSVPGETWPNRMYAVAGTAGGEVDIPATVLEGLWGVHTFFRELDDAVGDDGEPVTWRWYSSDPALLRAFDRKYRLDDRTDRFCYFDEWTERQERNFIVDAAEGTLPNVSWVDPHFFNLPHGLDGPNIADDDHPPQDVALGQAFVHKVYEAIRKSPQWERTLMMVVYDEHGGFFDHAQVPKPFGPRIPALVISPWLAPGRPCHLLFEHTSIVKTVLRRFADDTALERMGPRVYYANDVWSILNEPAPRPLGPVTDRDGNAVPAPPLTTRYLEWPASTLQRTVEIIDELGGDVIEFRRDLLLVFEELRRAAPRAIARFFSRIFRRAPYRGKVAHAGRTLVTPLLRSRVVPRRARPIRDRQP